MSDSVAVQCPNCQATLKLKSRSAVGKRVPCPKCQKPFVVEIAQAAEETSLSFADSETASTKPNRKTAVPRGATEAPRHRRSEKAKGKAKPAKSNVSPILLIGGGVVAVLGIVVAAVVFLRPSAATAPAAGDSTVIATSVRQAKEDKTVAPPSFSEPSEEDSKADSEQAKSDSKKKKKSGGPAGAVITRLDKKSKSDEKNAEENADESKVVVADNASNESTDNSAAAETPEPTEASDGAAAEKEVAVVVTDAAPEATNADVPVPTGPVLGRKVDPFELVATDNTKFSLAGRKEQVLVVAFMGVDCPLANLYLARMNELAEHFKGKPVAFVAINANEQDVLNDVRTQAQSLKLSFPMLKDVGNVIADRFGAQRTPEAFVLDEQRVIRYRGAFDDQYGYQFKRKEPTQNYVADAVTALLTKKDVKLAETDVEGCHIGRKQSASSNVTVSYYRDILPLMQTHCQECHRPGQIGPFELMEYSETANWGETIKEAVQAKRMPPWKADPAHGEFVNDLSLAQAEIDLISRWVDEGCPEGNSADAPPPKDWIDEWNIGKPDVVYTMPKPYDVAATGTIDYQYFIASEVFTEDRWIKAAECRLGNPKVVHHMLVLLVHPAEPGKSQNGLDKGFFASGVPGTTHVIYPDGYAKRLPKGSQLVFQMHYTANGKPQTDQSSIGLVFTDPPEHELQTYALGSTNLRVPAGEANHRETYTETIPKPVRLAALMPHMHVRGKSFEYKVTYPDGKQETLLSVPAWDFNWQHQYEFKEPVMLPKGSKLTVTATWDNSESNANNVFPLVDAKWGDQTWDEMFIGYVNYIVTEK